MDNRSESQPPDKERRLRLLLKTLLEDVRIMKPRGMPQREVLVHASRGPEEASARQRPLKAGLRFSMKACRPST